MTRRRHTRPLRRLGTLVGLALVATVLPVPGPAPTTPEIRHAALPVPGGIGARDHGRTWTSEPLRSPFPFSLVGLRWTGDEDADGLELRVRGDDGWRPWEPTEALDAGPNPSSSEERGIVSTEPLWVGEATDAQVRWSGGPPPDGLELHVVDPGPDPAPGPGAARAATSRPGIISRAEWGADESLRTCCPRYAPELKMAFVHHTATSNDYSREEADDVVRAIYAYHTESNGWDDIGYNLLVDRYGRIYEGRAGGVGRAVIGAHARGFNTGSTGVGVIGSFNGANPPQAALDALDRLLAWKLDVHHVDPEATATMTSGGSNKYPEGEEVELHTISGHRDAVITSCPGDLLYDDLGSIREDARAMGLPKIFDPDASPRVVTPDGDGKNDETTYSARLTGTLDWEATVRNGRGEAVRRFSGSGDSVRFSWNGEDENGEQVPYGHYRVRLEARDADPARTASTGVGVWRYDRPIAGIDSTEGRPGYWLVDDDGAVFPAGTARSHGSMAGRSLAHPIVGIAGTPTDEGYWLVASDGGIFTFGDAKFKGSMGGKPLDEPVVGMASTSSRDGYWLVASDGGIFTFGDAKFKGSMGGKSLVRPVVGMAPTSSGDGYWMVASDGGIFTFGDAKFKGSMGGAPLDEPVVGMAPTPSGDGYWLVATDGGVFTFGDAKFKGSLGGRSLPAPIIGMAPTPSGEGYWLVGRHGKVYAFGDAEGSVVPPL